MTKLIKTIIHNFTSKKEITHENILPENKRVVRSTNVKSDEYGYFNRMGKL